MAALCVVGAAAAWDSMGWMVVLPLYASVSFGLLAVAYAGAGPRLLFKRATGRRSVFGWLLFAPYFLLNAMTFGLYRRLSRAPAYAQVVPNLVFGRRLSAHEYRAGGWTSVLDLAGEFSAPRPQRESPGYRSLPVLDATAPTEAELRSAVAWIAEAIAMGPVYVHCALGHGRSACVIIAYLLSIGAVGTVAEGMGRLRSLRPGVRLHRSQLRQLRRFEPLSAPEVAVVRRAHTTSHEAIMTGKLAGAVREAAKAGDVAALTQLIATHGGPTVRLDDDPEELTALHWAAASGHVEAVRLLLASPVGADPRAVRVNNFSPLHSSAMLGHAQVCEVLLAAGADVDVQTDPQGYAPLHSAAFAGHVAAIRVLLAHGADRTLRNYRDEQPVDTARRTGQAEAVRVLESKDA